MNDISQRALDSCVLLFSGGRDSTVAALRLAKSYSRLTLVTVTTPHLVGLNQVRERLIEIRALLPTNTLWIHALAEPSSLVTIGSSAIESCLPCHRVYLNAAMWIASKQAAQAVALGYTSYQGDWLEQTPYAISLLRQVLSDFGKELILPAADLKSKEEARSILLENGLSQSALEQTCLQQQYNDSDLSSEQILSEINAWAQTLRRTFAQQTLTNIHIRPGISLDQVAINDNA